MRLLKRLMEPKCGWLDPVVVSIPLISRMINIQILTGTLLTRAKKLIAVQTTNNVEGKSMSDEVRY